MIMCSCFPLWSGLVRPRTLFTQNTRFIIYGQMYPANWPYLPPGNMQQWMNLLALTPVIYNLFFSRTGLYERTEEEVNNRKRKIRQWNISLNGLDYCLSATESEFNKYSLTHQQRTNVGIIFCCNLLDKEWMDPSSLPITQQHCWRVSKQRLIWMDGLQSFLHNTVGLVRHFYR